MNMLITHALSGMTSGALDLTFHTVRLLVPGHFYFYAVSKFSLRENDISVLLL